MNKGESNSKKKVFALTILSIAMSVALINTPISVIYPGSVYGADDNWYVGKGVKPNMYVTYKIQSHDTNQGQPFTMTTYFKEFNDTGHYWVAPVYVNDQGKIINGTFHLSDLDLTALGSSKIPPAMSPYRSAYTSSLEWLSAFVPKPGQSLSSPNWGKIASIGGSPIGPGGQEKITVPAGIFDTKVISWHKGVDNKIWINKDMPYPIKAQTFADTTTTNPPIQYAFELVATGQGQPAVPKSVLEIPKSPLTLQTARGTYYIKLLWGPDPIKVGIATDFGLLFLDNSQTLVDKQVSYSFKVTDMNGTVIKDIHNQQALGGTGTQKDVKFEKPGPVDVTVRVEGVQGENMGDFVESADFNLYVSN
jgi:hypothetical protein